MTLVASANKYFEQLDFSQGYGLFCGGALEVARLSMQELKVKGIPLKEAMKKFADWIAK